MLARPLEQPELAPGQEPEPVRPEPGLKNPLVLLFAHLP
jgi:hypothetical protein